MIPLPPHPDVFYYVAVKSSHNDLWAAHDKIELDKQWAIVHDYTEHKWEIFTGGKKWGTVRAGDPDGDVTTIMAGLVVDARKETSEPAKFDVPKSPVRRPRILKVFAILACLAVACFLLIRHFSSGTGSSSATPLKCVGPIAIATPCPIDIGGQRQAVLTTAQEVGVFSFSGSTGDVMSITVDTGVPQAMSVALVDPGGRTVASNRNSLLGGTAIQSQRLDATGTFHIVTGIGYEMSTPFVVKVVRG
jgi:hypothetical protein